MFLTVEHPNSHHPGCHVSSVCVGGGGSFGFNKKIFPSPLTSQVFILFIIQIQYTYNKY